MRAAALCRAHWKLHSVEIWVIDRGAETPQSQVNQETMREPEKMKILSGDAEFPTISKTKQQQIIRDRIISENAKRYEQVLDQTDLKGECLKDNIFIKSLILAQDERWRRV